MATKKVLTIGSSGHPEELASSDQLPVANIPSEITRTLLTDGTVGLTNNHHYLACDASGGSFTQGLPDAATCPNKVYKFKKIDASVNTITLDPNGAQTIDGQATMVLSIQWEGLALISTGAGWEIIT